MTLPSLTQTTSNHPKKEISNWLDKVVLEPFTDIYNGIWLKLDFPFPLNHLITLERGKIITLAGESGTGKTAIMDSVLLHFYTQKEIILTTFYFVLERPIKQKIQKLFNKFYMDKHVRTVSEKTGLIGLKKRLQEQKISLEDFKTNYDVTSKDISDIIADPEGEVQTGKINFFNAQEGNPTGIYKTVLRYMNKNGKTIYQKYINSEGRPDKRRVGYEYNRPNEIVLAITDTFDRIKQERGKDKFFTVDKSIEYFGQEFRDIYAISSIHVNQFNKSKSNNMREDKDAKLSDVKFSSQLVEASDVVLLLSNPSRDKLDVFCEHYKTEDFKTNKGNNIARTLSLAKNSDEIDGVVLGYAFFGDTGTVEFLPPLTNLTKQQASAKAKIIAKDIINTRTYKQKSI